MRRQTTVSLNHPQGSLIPMRKMDSKMTAKNNDPLFEHENEESHSSHSSFKQDIQQIEKPKRVGKVKHTVRIPPNLNTSTGGAEKPEDWKQDKYGHIMHYVKTNFKDILGEIYILSIANRRENLFTTDDLSNDKLIDYLEKNDVYHRLFKDSKIKRIQANEFVEFLKMKQSGELSQTISAMFIKHGGTKSLLLNSYLHKNAYLPVGLI